MKGCLLTAQRPKIENQILAGLIKVEGDRCPLCFTAPWIEEPLRRHRSPRAKPLGARLTPVFTSPRPARRRRDTTTPLKHSARRCVTRPSVEDIKRAACEAGRCSCQALLTVIRSLFLLLLLRRRLISCVARAHASEPAPRSASPGLSQEAGCHKWFPAPRRLCSACNLGTNACVMLTRAPGGSVPPPLSSPSRCSPPSKMQPRA